MLTESRSHSALELQLRPAAVVRVWLAIVLVGQLLFVLADHWWYHAAVDAPTSLRRLFNLGREDSLGAAFGIAATGLVAVAAWIGYGLQRRLRGVAGARAWLLIALFLTVMAADDMAHVHERIGTLLGDLFAAEAAAWWARFPSYAWQTLFVPVYGLAGTLAAAALWRRLRPGRLRRAPVGAVACWIASVGLDFVEGLDPHAPLHPYSALARAVDLRGLARGYGQLPFDLLLHLGRVIEESIELAGVALFGAAVLYLVIRMLDGLAIRVPVQESG